jgi:hypothetical protein
MVAAPDHAPELYPSLLLPVARFTGEAFDLGEQYDGASHLANLVVERTIVAQPEYRLQVTTWLRKGRMKLATTFVAPNLGKLLVQVRVGDGGRTASLATIRQNEEAPHESWEVLWGRGAAGFDVLEATRQTVRSTESFNYDGAVPVIAHAPTDAELAEVSNLALRAANTFEAYSLDLAIAAGQLQLTSFHLDRA